METAIILINSFVIGYFTVEFARWIAGRIFRKAHVVVELDGFYAVRKKRFSKGNYVDLKAPILSWKPGSKHFADCLTVDRERAVEIAMKKAGLIDEPLKGEKIYQSFG